MNGKFNIDLSNINLSDEERATLEASIEDQILIELASVDTGAVKGGSVIAGGYPVWKDRWRFYIPKNL